MKKSLLLVIIYFFIVRIPLFPQSDKDSYKIPSDSSILKAAYKSFYGINKPVDYEKAYKYFKYLAIRNNADALNALGIMYKKGLGVKKDVNTAFKYFYKSHLEGSMTGTCNLAIAYRKGEGVGQNYRRAFELFDSSAARGYSQAYYFAGEMLYKGFGIKQNYKLALAYFEKGAQLGQKDCIYMLGCANLNGNGTPQDIEKSKKYFNKAMSKGHPWVQDIIEKNIFDSAAKVKNQRLKSGKVYNSSDTLKYAANNAKLDDLIGEWNGKFFIYDWSGKNIEKEVPVTLKFYNYFDSAFVTWIEEGVEKYNFMVYKKSKAWMIKKFTFITTPESKAGSQIFRQIKFGFKQTKNAKILEGNVLIVSNKTRDRLKPNSFILKRDETTDEQNSNNANGLEMLTIINVYPNPFQNNVQIVFELKEDDNIRFEIYNVYGNKVLMRPPQAFSKGRHTVNLSTGRLNFGTYIIHVSGTNVTKTVSLLKN